MALVIMGTVGLEKEKYRLGHTKVLVFVFVQHENDFQVTIGIIVTTKQSISATFFCGMMKCKSRGCYGVFLIPSLTLGVLPCWCPWYDGRVQGRAGQTLVMALVVTMMAAMRTMATMITVMMFAAKVTKITTWLQAAARGSLARLQYIKLRWESNPYLQYESNSIPLTTK